VYADSAYKSEEHELCLSERAYRNKLLSKHDKGFNRLHSGVRCTVKRIFGVLKPYYDMAKARYMGLARNRIRFKLMSVAHNIKQSFAIQQASCFYKMVLGQ